MHAMGAIGVLVILLAVAGTGAMGGWGMSAMGEWGMGNPGSMPHMGGGRNTPPATAAAPIAGAERVAVSLVDFGFRPGVIRLQAGKPVNLEVVNTGRVLHDLTIPALGFRAVVQPGQRATVGLPAAPGGEYEFYCSVPGHREAGMAGQLIVAP